MRVLFSVLLCLALAASAFAATPTETVSSFETRSAALKKASSKALPRLTAALSKLLEEFESSSSFGASSFADAPPAGVPAAVSALGQKLLAVVTETSSLLGVVEADADWTPERKGLALKASVACPPLVSILSDLVDVLPFGELAPEPVDGPLLKSAQMLGYTLSHAISDYSCRPHVPLFETVQRVDRARTRYVDKIDADRSPTAQDTVEVWSDLRDHLATYLTSVHTLAGLDGSVAGAADAAPADADADDLFKASALADMLDARAALTAEEEALAGRVDAAAGPALKDEL